MATIERAPEALTPGADPVAIPVEVRNTTDIVQAYDIEVLGVPASFATVEPPTLRLYPGTSGTATVTLLAPRSADVRAGEYPMGVKVIPTESPQDATVPETTVRVLPFMETTAELIPRTSRGRRGATHDLAIDNRGNIPLKCFVAGNDDNQALSLDEQPQTLEVGPGEARFGVIAVKPVQRMWRGTPRTHPFVVTVTPHDGPAVVLDGTHLQEPLIPKWFWRLLLALLALLLLLIALWFLLLKPTIELTAQDAVADDVAAAVDAAAEAEQQADTAGGAALAAQENAASAQESAQEAADIAGTTAPPPAVVQAPDSRRLDVLANEGGGTGVDPFTLDANQTLAITDVVFENPNGDTGIIELLVDADVVLRLGAENFRAIDFHFVTPIVVSGGEEVQLSIFCQTAGSGTQCSNSALVSGELTTQVAP